MKKLKEIKKFFQNNFNKIVTALVVLVAGVLIVYFIFLIRASHPLLTGGLDPGETLNPSLCAPGDPDCLVFPGWYVNQTEIRENQAGTYAAPLTGGLFYIDTIIAIPAFVLKSTASNMIWDEAETNLVAGPDVGYIGSESVSTAEDVTYTINWNSGNQVRVDINIDPQEATVILAGTPQAGQLLRAVVCTVGPLTTINWTSAGSIKWANNAPLNSLGADTCMPVTFLASSGESNLEIFAFYGNDEYPL